jgi:hypothetical protein
MDAQMVKTIEMTRHIREQNSQRLVGKSHKDRIAYYREQAQKMEKAIPVLLQEKGDDILAATSAKL